VPARGGAGYNIRAYLPRNHPPNAIIRVFWSRRDVIASWWIVARASSVRSGAAFRRVDLNHSHFDDVRGIPGLISTLRLRQSTDVITIHNGLGTLVLARKTDRTRSRFAGVVSHRILMDCGEHAIDKTQGVPDATRRKHDESTASIQEQLEVMEEGARAEEARWRKEESRLEKRVAAG
jgi:hypothetical protein